MEYFAISDIGNCREKNEDFFFADKNLFIVADGMGGHAAGEVASRNAINFFLKSFFSKSSLKKIAQNDEIIESSGISNVMLSSIKYANKKIYRLSVSNGNYKGMGTTFTACFLKNSVAHILHVGDSRIYLKNNKKFTLLTQDHTVVRTLYERGLITYDEISSHPLKNYLENALGIEYSINPDYFYVNLETNDKLLICTDGLNSMLKDKDIEKIVSKKMDPKSISENLVKKAKSNGGSDNITVITIIV
jgi:PPM family protein phosphatase